MKSNNTATVVVDWFNSSSGQDKFLLPLGKSLGLQATLALGPTTPPPSLCDLVDLTTCVFFIERRLRGRQKTNTPSRISLSWPVRDFAKWTPAILHSMEEILELMGNAVWILKPVAKSTVPPPDSKHSTENTKSGPLVLFSGGLDSTSGVAGSRDRKNFILCSFYTQQKTVQKSLARQLGIDPPIQWTWKERLPRTRGRNFYYRSTLFLSIGAFTASSFGLKTILQFENGVLATAVHPAPSYRMTLHAHPRIHRIFESILNGLTAPGWSVKNPHLLLTKRQAVERAAQEFGSKFFEIARQTQSCWAYQAPRLYGMKKTANKSCGVCVPCIVRRTALRSSTEYKWNLNHLSVRNDLRGEHFRNYFGFAERILAQNSNAEFYRLLDGSSRESLGRDGFPDLNSTHKLFRIFAAEFKNEFPS